MLKQRIITAVLLAPIVIIVIIRDDPVLVLSLFGLIQFFANFEWLKMNQIKQAVAVVIAAFVTMASILIWVFSPNDIPWSQLILLFLVAVWLPALWWLVNYRPGQGHKSHYLLVKKTLGLIALILMFISIQYINNQINGNWWLLILLLLIWVADIGAYVSGKTLGKHKLAVNISPGKTWEGVFGAQLFVILFAFLISFLMQVPWMPLLWVFPMVALFSIVGDLSASLSKRQAGIKDSSQLLPGHGGFIDRFDSLVAAAPLYSVLMFGL